MRALVALLAALVPFAVQAQFPHAGVFPGRLPGDIVSPPTPPPPSLQAPWSQDDVGSPPAGNTASSISGVLTSVCQGLVSFTADTGMFVNQAVSGDFEMIGPAATITADTVWSRDVPRVSQSPTATGSKYFGFFFDHRNQVAANWRTATDAHNDYVGFDTPWTSSTWWRIARVGNAFSGYLGTSSAGPWTLNGTQTVTMSDPVYAGRLCDNGGDAHAATQVSLLPVINALGGSSPGFVQFAQPTDSVNENGSPVTISVPRASGTTGAGSAVVSRLGSSTATLGTDYTVSCTLPCTLSWTNGDGADKTLTVTPINRAGSQSSRHLDLSLGSASTVILGSPSTEILTINDVSAGGQTKLRSGYYTDCYPWMPHGGDFNHFIGSDGYTAFRSCVDWSATQTGIKGVFIPTFWASLEGDTAGTYDGTVGNGLASAGKIGFLLLHDMLNYAKSKHLTVLLESDWFNYYNDADCTVTHVDNSPNGSYTIRGSLPKYLLATACGGTDSGNVYSGGYYVPGFDGSNHTFYTKFWKSAVMDRWIALMNAYAVEFDNDDALEGWIMFGEEGDSTISPQDGSQDGYTFASIDAQFKRIVSEVKPNWPHTDIIIATAWMRGSQALLAEAATSAAKAVSVSSNNTVPQRTDYGQAAYLGVANPPDNTNSGTHNYQGELGFTMWQATNAEISCTTGSRYGYLTKTQIYDALMTNGFTDAHSRPLKPNRWILADYQMGLQYCASEPDANWGLIGGTGWYNFIQTHPVNTVCPTKWTGGCKTTQP